MKTYHYFWQLIRFRPRYYATDLTSITIHSMVMIGLGLILRAFFNHLTGEEGFSLSLWPVVALQILYGVVSAVTLAIAILAHINFKFHGMALMMRNMLGRILEMPGARPLPINDDGTTMSAGQAISTFRDDTNEMIMTMTLAEDLLGLMIMAFMSLAIMMSINPFITLGTFLPLFFIIAIVQRLGKLVKKVRAASREATSQVTGVIADMFNATQAIKVANAEERITAHFQKLNDRRRETMVKDRLLTQTVEALSGGATDLGMGLVLLLAAQAMYAGTFTIGDFALFAAFLWPMTHLMRMTGNVLTRYKQSEVSIGRMERIMQGAPTGAVVAHQPIYMDGRYPEIPPISKTAADRLQTLTVRNLTYLYPHSDNGIHDIHFQLRQGSLTVITGRIGAGKTTLLKTLLGLLPTQGGEIWWNDQLVTDPTTFFTPPRCAYTGQAPRLFSETLRNNILLGLLENRADVDRALHTAVFDKDLRSMDDGLETLVGPRGVRLSGGQIQRAAAARMFIRDAELLIFDDLSSALDVNTEKVLWERLFESKKLEVNSEKLKVNGGKASLLTFDSSLITCLVVSHRRAVLRRADHIIILKEGRIEDEGSLAELLARSPEMQQLWQADAGEQEAA